MIRHAKRFFVLVFGGTIVIIGLLLLVLPSPGTLVIIAGLALLATEFVWAERILHKTKHHYRLRKNNQKNHIKKIQQWQGLTD